MHILIFNNMCALNLSVYTISNRKNTSILNSELDLSLYFGKVRIINSQFFYKIIRKNKQKTKER